MSARRHLNPDQFDLRNESTPGVHTVAAYHPSFLQGEAPVGFMIWDDKTGRISNIDVDETKRRQGIGRRMYEHAVNNPDIFPTSPKHDVPKNRTAQGKKWAAAMGGPSV